MFIRHTIFFFWYIECLRAWQRIATTQAPFYINVEQYYSLNFYINYKNITSAEVSETALLKVDETSMIGKVVFYLN